jgi:hypothetical protein
MSFIGPCMCRGVVSVWEDWNKEYPCCEQGVMHSPVGCIRRDLSIGQLRALYREMSGYIFPDSSKAVLFQAVMSQFKINPEIAQKYPVVLTPVATVSTIFNVEETPPLKRKRVGGTVDGVGSTVTPAKLQKKPDVVVNPGPIKPPWVK